MKKYIAFVKAKKEGMGGIYNRILTKFSDDMTYLNKWVGLYPGADHVILSNTQELEKFFIDFEDLTPVTEEEVQASIQAYKEFIHED